MFLNKTVEALLIQRIYLRVKILTILTPEILPPFLLINVLLAAKKKPNEFSHREDNIQ